MISSMVWICGTSLFFNRNDPVAGFFIAMVVAGIVSGALPALLSIINDILDFSKIEAGKVEPACEPFLLRAGLGQTLQAIAVRAAGTCLTSP